MVFKELFLTVSTLGGYGGPERRVSTLGGCGGLERSVFNSSTFGGYGGPERSFYFGGMKVVLKEQILNSFLLLGGMVVLKELII